MDKKIYDQKQVYKESFYIPNFLKKLTFHLELFS